MEVHWGKVIGFSNECEFSFSAAATDHAGIFFPSSFHRLLHIINLPPSSTGCPHWLESN